MWSYVMCICLHSTMMMYKVWNGDRTTRKCVLAQSFEDLLAKGKCLPWIIINLTHFDVFIKPTRLHLEQLELALLGTAALYHFVGMHLEPTS